MSSAHKNIIVVFMAISFFACDTNEHRFRRVPSSESGITFKNVLKESVEFNIFNYMYFYNGGGVATGDLNGDDLADIYFTSNQDLNRLYLNQGNFKFIDITEIAGVGGFNGWTTGVTFADVNNDGRLDIYVSYLGDYLIYNGKNQLFINEGNDDQGIPRFTDRAIELGLDLIGFSTQAAFLDYDNDNDLDMFMLTHSLHQEGTFAKASLRKGHHALAGDKLMRNDGGHFIDVTKEAGIYNSVLGYGLGVVVSDVNLDGWPDIYVGNDFHENDYLYINQGNGTFQEKLESSMMHTSRFTMGVDFADFNNDAFPDLISMDMLPDDPKILKASGAEDPYEIYNFKLGFGYHPQLARNALQLNNHDGTFSEIALLAGVSATDWSWSSLFADFDLDGRKDILVTNGILRRPNDLDYLNFIQIDSVQTKLDKMTSKELAYIDKMPTMELKNYLFKNNGDSTFTNQAETWGLTETSYSNGATYADLDNDGDLDIIMNNVEAEAFVYENRTIHKNKADSVARYIQVLLQGKPGNRFGVGAKVFVYNDGSVQMQECMATRGFQSAVDHRLTFGLGTKTLIDTLKVVWSDGSFQKLSNVKSNQLLIVKQENATSKFNYAEFQQKQYLVINEKNNFTIPFKHRENKFAEFNREQLLPHMLSAEGPGVAVGDINGDGLEDVFLGGGKRQAGEIFIQTSQAKFLPHPQEILKADSIYEDVDAEFVDLDRDSDLDLLVASGGNEFSGKSKYRQPRAYLNDGKGTFSRSAGLPDIFMTGSCIAASDYDDDGDVDLFLGARAIPWRYGLKPDSYLLINDGSGKFTDGTARIAPALKKFGFIKDATWSDVNGDQHKDLVIAAEWSPITIFLNRNGQLIPLSLEGSGLELTHGWWNAIESEDFDRDGDQDFVVGNLGLNSKLKASTQEPVRMYVGDFDKNDSTDQILTHIINGAEYPFNTRDEMTKQMPYLKKKFLSYNKFAAATITEMFDKNTLEGSEKYEAYTFASVYVENLGRNKFKVKTLPKAAQFSTIEAILVDDVDMDGKTDLLVGGNFNYANIQMGRYDASYGLILKGDGKGNFQSIPAYKCGFSVRGEIRQLVKVQGTPSPVYLAVRNNDTVAVYSSKSRKLLP